MLWNGFLMFLFGGGLYGFFYVLGVLAGAMSCFSEAENSM